MWSSGKGSWLQIQWSGFDSRHYQTFWVEGLERGHLSLVTTNEELLGRKSSYSGLENREYCRRGPARWPLYTPLFTNFATSGGRTFGIVRSRINNHGDFFICNSHCIVSNCWIMLKSEFRKAVGTKQPWPKFEVLSRLYLQGAEGNTKNPRVNL
jgi:hypothetical protein